MDILIDFINKNGDPMAAKSCINYNFTQYFSTTNHGDIKQKNEMSRAG